MITLSFNGKADKTNAILAHRRCNNIGYKIEELEQHLAELRLGDGSSLRPGGRTLTTADEWFSVPLTMIDEAISLLNAGTITNFEYDPNTRAIGCDSESGDSDPLGRGDDRRHPTYLDAMIAGWLR